MTKERMEEQPEDGRRRRKRRRVEALPPPAPVPEGPPPVAPRSGLEERGLCDPVKCAVALAGKMRVVLA